MKLKEIREFNRRIAAEEVPRDGDGREIIQMTVSEDEDFLSPYSVAGNKCISDGVADFLDEAVKPMSMDGGVRVVITSGVIDDGEKVEYTAAFKNFYRGRAAETSHKLRRNLAAVIVLLVCAVAVLSAYVALEVTGHNHVLLELIDIVAWVFMWEAVDKFFFERRELSRQFVKEYSLFTAEITFVDTPSA